MRFSVTTSGSGPAPATSSDAVGRGPLTILLAPRIHHVSTDFAMPDPTIALIYAHPYAERSLANRELLAAIEGLAFVEQRPLYDLYPDFDIDADAERERLEAVDLIVLQHPVFWYSMPALLKQWIDEVFALGWAYGKDGDKLAGKSLQWVVTTGADFKAYAPDGPHGHPFDVFLAPMRQTARFCGMEWLDPIVVHDAHADRTQVAAMGQRYRQRLVDFHERHPAATRRKHAAASEYLADENDQTEVPADLVTGIAAR